MRLQETVLRPGEFAIYLDTNRSVELGRLLAFFDCFRWINDDGFVPAYDLEIIDLQKKCIFARFGFVWRNGHEPDATRLSKMEREIADLRETIDATAVSTAAAADAQVDIARKMLIVTATGSLATIAIGALGLILDFVKDARAESPNECAAAIADLMEHDAVQTLRIWSPDCTAVLEKRDVPEMLRREEGIRLQVGEVANRRSKRQATLINAPFSTPSEETDHNYVVDSYSSKTAFPLPEQLKTGDTIKYPTAPIFALNGPEVQFSGHVQYNDGVMLFWPDSPPAPKRPTLMVPQPPLHALRDGGRYRIGGRMMRSEGPADTISLSTIQRID